LGCKKSEEGQEHIFYICWLKLWNILIVPLKNWYTCCVQIDYDIEKKILSIFDRKCQDHDKYADIWMTISPAKHVFIGIQVFYNCETNVYNYDTITQDCIYDI
jgi:hypothetical protein